MSSETHSHKLPQLCVLPTVELVPTAELGRLGMLWLAWQTLADAGLLKPQRRVDR
jgi:hypothetical protein